MSVVDDMKIKDTLIIFTRYPEPGNVKNRLISVLGKDGAASLQEDMAKHALETARNFATTDGIVLEVHYTGGDERKMETLFGTELCFIPQEGIDLGEKMHASFLRAFTGGSQRVVLIGTDCPGITTAILRQAFSALKGCDCAIGPSADGGYYLIGLKGPMPEIFQSIPWGTGKVLKHTLEIIKGIGLQVVLLDRLLDIDRPEDLSSWHEAAKARSLPMISVIIPAIDEKIFIRQTLKSALAGKNVEVIVADGGSIDGTRELATSLGARVVPTHKGRAAQMNEGAGHALGDILLFAHADSVLPRGYDDAIRSALADSDVAAGAFSLGFHEGTFVMDLIAFGANLRSHYLKLPYGDQGFFVREGTFHNAGGFPEVPIMEDVAFIRTMKKKGRVVILPSMVATSSRRFQTISPFRTWVLNQLAMVGFFLGMPNDDLAVLYRSRERSIGVWMKHLMMAVRNRVIRRA